MFEYLRRDKRRYAKLGAGAWFTHPGFWIVAVYRFGMWAAAFRSPLLRLPMWAIYRAARIPTRIFNVELWAGRDGARIGPGLCIIHPSNIYIGKGTDIGENCLMMHEVTLAVGHVPGTPRVGDNVDIYVGARILGGVTIGDGCMIGANCVVTKDVPTGSVMLAAPGRIVPRSLSPLARASDREDTHVSRDPP